LEVSVSIPTARQVALALALALTLPAAAAPPGQDRDRALVVAVLRGQFRETEGLLNRGANLNGRDRMGRTPLMLAAMAERVQIVSLLLSRGAAMDLQDHDRQTAYDHAFGSAEIRFLIEEQQNARARGRR
jgi:ankyrin repeat protein